MKLVSKGTRSPNGGGDLPLHLAARYNPNLDVKYILAAEGVTSQATSYVQSLVVYRHFLTDCLWLQPSALISLNARGHTPFDVANVEVSSHVICCFVRLMGLLRSLCAGANSLCSH